MVKQQDKLLWQKVISSIPKIWHNRVEFFVVGRIISFCIIEIEFLTEKGNRLTLLTKNSSYAYTRGITSDLKGFSKVKVPKKRSCGHFHFDVSKGLVAARVPENSPFFRQSMIGNMIELNPLMDLL